MYETKKIREIAERKSDEIAQIQHSIFDLAEYGYEVQKSASYLEALLEKEGFQVERGIGDIETAFVGTYGSGNPVIGILAECAAKLKPESRRNKAVSHRRKSIWTCLWTQRTGGRNCRCSDRGQGVLKRNRKDWYCKSIWLSCRGNRIW